MTDARDDLVTFGETMLRLSPPRGERLETTTSLDAQAGGAESNVAVAASQLGADATWISKLPDSALGRRIERELRGHGVDVDVAWDGSPDARLGTYFLEFGGEPRGVDVTYDRADASVTTVSPEELAVERVESARWFHTTGITPALSERAAETTAALLDAAGEGGATRSFDLNYRSKLWDPETAAAAYEALFPRVDVLFAPRRDAAETLGVTGDAAAVARELDDRYGFDAVVVTRGAEGALVLADGEIHERGVFDAETFDAIGTGDAFVGGFIARRLAGGDRPDALEWGAATAALKRTLAGDMAVVTPAEVERVVDEGDGGISR